MRYCGHWGRGYGWVGRVKVCLMVESCLKRNFVRESYRSGSLTYDGWEIRVRTRWMNFM